MTYGYNATPALDNSTADIVDHARDLLECLVERRKEAIVSLYFSSSRNNEIDVARVERKTYCGSVSLILGDAIYRSMRASDLAES